MTYKYMKEGTPPCAQNPMLKVDTDPFTGTSRLQTGDVIMCHSSCEDSPIDKVIEEATHSPWEHTGIVVRDPWWLDEKHNGLFILQSGSGPNGYPDIIDGSRSGVTLNRLEDFLANRVEIYVMSLSGQTWTDKSRMMFSRSVCDAHGKPYDKNPLRWCLVGITSFLRCGCCAPKVVPRQTNVFWCSALVAFVFVKNGWLSSDLDWTCQTPADIITWTTEPGVALGRPWKIK